MTEQFLQLVGNPIFWVLVFSYWIFSAAASALPEPSSTSGNGYKFLFTFVRTLAGQVKGAFAKYIPGAEDSKAQAGFARITALLLLGVVAGLMLFGAWSCSSWERTTFQTLSASKKVVDCSAAAYNHDVAKVQIFCADPQTVISQTSANRALIQKAREVQTAAVYAYRDYWCLAYPTKPADPALGFGPCSVLSEGATRDQVQAAQQKVVIAMQALPELVSQLKAIAGK